MIFILSFTTFAFDTSFEKISETASGILEKLDIKNITNLITSNVSSYSKQIFSNLAVSITIIIAGSVFSVINSQFTKTGAAA